MLTDKTIILGITGGIAAYKAADLASKLTQTGAKVEVIMTESATEFMSPLTLRTLTDRSVVTDMFDQVLESSIDHIALAEAADVVVTVNLGRSHLHPCGGLLPGRGHIQRNDGFQARRQERWGWLGESMVCASGRRGGTTPA